MTDILARWKGQGSDDNQKEREAERRWAWILNHFRIKDALDDPDSSRSLGSHWGRFAQELNPETFLLKDLLDISSVFSDYLDNKGKVFIQDDIDAFVAWKFWEGKIQSRNIFAAEINACTIAWQKGKVKYAGIFEAFHHALKCIRADLVLMLFEKIYPHYSLKSEEGKSLINQLKKDCQEILRLKSQEIFDEVIKKNIDALPQSKQMPKIEGSEEE